jgi:hypothetical protein
LKIADVEKGAEYLVRAETFARIERRLRGEALLQKKLGEDPDGELWELFYVPFTLQTAYDGVMKKVRVIETKIPYGKSKRRSGVRIEAYYPKGRLSPDGWGFEMDDDDEIIDDIHTFECIIEAVHLVDPIEYEVERFRSTVKLWERGS